MPAEQQEQGDAAAPRIPQTNGPPQPAGAAASATSEVTGTRTRRGAPAGSGNNQQPHVQPAGDAAAGISQTTGLAPAAPGQVPGDESRNNQLQAPADQQATGDTEQRGGPQGRLKITVAAEKKADDDDKDFMEKMRGWLMTVAALFVNMAFAAVLHPPEWMKLEWYNARPSLKKHRNVDGIPASSAAPAPSPASDATTVSLSHYLRGRLYLTFNTVTFATALALLLVLLVSRSTTHRNVLAAQLLTLTISVFVAGTFALGTTENWWVTGAVVFGMVIYVAMVILVTDRLTDRYF